MWKSDIPVKSIEYTLVEQGWQEMIKKRHTYAMKTKYIYISERRPNGSLAQCKIKNNLGRTEIYFLFFKLFKVVET